MELAKVVIREALPIDNPCAIEIVGNSLREFGIEPDFKNIDIAVGDFGTVHSSNLIELIAELEGIVCGCIVIQLLPQPEIGKITGFHLIPKYRGVGIGKSLLIACVIEAKKKALNRLQLDTWDHMHSAIHLYEGLGWQRDVNPPPESGANRSYFIQL